MFNKYVSVFKISLQNDFAYRMNFLMWRIRNVIQILITYYLWSSLFSTPNQHLFGYSKEKIISYVFSIIIVRALVFSAKAMDVAGEVANGDLNNYLLKPVNYFKYWFTRDISSKILNLFFATIEMALLSFIFKPQFFLQTDIFYLCAFLIAVIFATISYFLILLIVSSASFWLPEMAWGFHFLITVIIVEFLSGSLFPLDILPETIQSIIKLTPFPYLIYFPISIYLGTINLSMIWQGLLISTFWLLILWLLLKFIWNRGLKVYQAFGR